MYSRFIVVRSPRFSFKSKYYFEQKQKKKYIFAKKNNYLPILPLFVAQHQKKS
jgi:hypothetical protein